MTGFFGLAISVWAWRYLEDRRKRWLVGVAVATVLGAWTVPVFVLFAGPLWLLLLIVVRNRAVLLIGVGSAVGLVLVYLPVLDRLANQADGYSDVFGEEFQGVNGALDSLRQYLLDDRRDNLPLVLCGVMLIGAVLVALPVISWVPTAVRQLVRVLAGAIVFFFAGCMVIGTTPIRTTSFAAVPVAVGGLAALGALLAGVRRLEVRGPLLLTLAAAGILIGYTGWSAAASFAYVPVENWKGAGEYINAIFPVGTQVFDASGKLCLKCPRPTDSSNLYGYLDDEHPLAVRFDPRAFADGRMVIVSWETGKPEDPTNAELAVTSPNYVEMDLAQHRGWSPPRRIRIISATPEDHHVRSATVGGVDAPALTDGASGPKDRRRCSSPGSPSRSCRTPASTADPS